MKIGDRVRDKGTQLVGTIVELDPKTGAATRARFQEDDTSKDRKVGDPPPDSMWQRLEELELIDLAGNPVTGKAGQQLDAPTPGSAGKDAPNKKSGAGATAN